MDIKIMQNNFIEYLETHYDYARPDVRTSDVFYSYRNPIGINFWDIFVNEASMVKARDLLEQKFIETRRKNPRRDAGIHYGYWTKFKEFLDNEYGGVANIK